MAVWVFSMSRVVDTLFLVVYFQGYGIFFHFQLLCLFFCCQFSTIFLFGWSSLLYLSTVSVRALDLVMSRGSMYASISYAAAGVDLIPPHINLTAWFWMRSTYYVWFIWLANVAVAARGCFTRLNVHNLCAVGEWLVYQLPIWCWPDVWSGSVV